MKKHFTTFCIIFLSATFVSVAAAKSLNNDDLISLIVGDGDAIDYRTRINAISALPITLEKEESEAGKEQKEQKEQKTVETKKSRRRLTPFIEKTIEKIEQR